MKKGPLGIGGEVPSKSQKPKKSQAVSWLFLGIIPFKEAMRSFLDVAPELVVEILSPDAFWLEVTKKLREYFAIGVNIVCLPGFSASVATLFTF